MEIRQTHLDESGLCPRLDCSDEGFVSTMSLPEDNQITITIPCEASTAIHSDHDGKSSGDEVDFCSFVFLSRQ